MVMVHHGPRVQLFINELFDVFDPKISLRVDIDKIMASNTSSGTSARNSPQSAGETTLKGFKKQIRSRRTVGLSSPLFPLFY